MMFHLPEISWRSFFLIFFAPLILFVCAGLLLWWAFR